MNQSALAKARFKTVKVGGVNIAKSLNVLIVVGNVQQKSLKTFKDKKTMQLQKDNTIRIKRLSEDNAFYNNVFKKTEKLVSVTFYILSETKTDKITETHLDIIRDKALKTHEVSLGTLTLQKHEEREGLLGLQYQLVGLESSLRVASVSGVITPEVFALLADQLDSIQRYINNHYLTNKGVVLEDTVAETKTKASANKTPTQRKQRVNIPAGDISTDAYMVYSQMTDRAERIKTVLEAKPQATVKDIAEVITDVSEKTIQRELNSLIEKGQVLREGERRWSRYSVAKGA